MDSEEGIAAARCGQRQGQHPCRAGSSPTSPPAARPG